jgi:hypothetical protein
MEPGGERRKPIPSLRRGTGRSRGSKEIYMGRRRERRLYGQDDPNEEINE